MADGYGGWLMAMAIVLVPLPSAISHQPSAMTALFSLAAAGPLFPRPFELRLRAAAPRAALALAHPLEDLDEAEIHLAQLHVHADDLHLHLVAEAVDLVRVLAAQQVRALDGPVVVVRHRRDVDHALDEMLHELDEEAEGRDAGHVALELVADLVG